METELIQVSSLESLQKAEVDSQIATAKRYPRMLSAVKKSMLEFATLDEETSEACFYSLPRGGKNIQGPSVRLAEIAVSCYGNIRAGSRILSVDSKSDTPHVVVQSVCHDLEKNIAVTIEKRRRITPKKDWKKGGHKSVDEDDINLAANAGAAIAFRDAVFKVVPMAIVKPVMEAAKKVAIGDAKTLKDRRAKCIATFTKMGISQEQVLIKLERKSVEDITLDDLETLLGLHNSIREGQIEVDEAFKIESLNSDPQPTKQEPSTEPEPAQANSGTPQEELAAVVIEAGHTFDDFIKWADNAKVLETKNLAAFDDVPEKEAKRFLRARAGMLQGIEQAKGGGE